jgi:hypothetical protein
MSNDTYTKWAAFYADKFERISNDALKGYWYLYGRDSEVDARSSRDLAAWAEVNTAMYERGL